MKQWNLAGAVLACLVLMTTGCKSGSLGPAKHYSQIDYAHGGTITGVVHFTGKAPAPVEIDMAQDPACAMSKDDMSETYVVNHGGLGNAVVFIQRGLGDRLYPITRSSVVIDQKGCRFHPHVSAAMVGQQVEFTNSDPTRHNVHMDPTVAGNSAFDVSQGPGASPVARYFHAPELMIPIRCNNHPWMHAYLSVLANPFFAVTDASGHFTIRGLPPGTYTIAVDQAKLGEKMATVTVKANGTTHQDFAFSSATAAPTS